MGEAGIYEIGYGVSALNVAIGSQPALFSLHVNGVSVPVSQNETRSIMRSMALGQSLVAGDQVNLVNETGNTIRLTTSNPNVALDAYLNIVRVQ